MKRDHDLGFPSGWRRTGRVVGAVMVTTTTVAAAAVVGLGVLGADQEGSYPAGRSALPTAIDSRPADAVYVPARFSGSPVPASGTPAPFSMFYLGLSGIAATGTTGR